MTEQIYKKAHTYKFELKKGIFYTGQVIQEEEQLILIRTIRQEEIHLNKSEILQSKLLGGL